MANAGQTKTATFSALTWGKLLIDAEEERREEKRRLTNATPTIQGPGQEKGVAKKRQSTGSATNTQRVIASLETNANFGMGTNPRESVARQEAEVSLRGTTMGIAGISSNMESAMAWRSATRQVVGGRYTGGSSH